MGLASNEGLGVTDEAPNTVWALGKVSEAGHCSKAVAIVVQNFPFVFIAVMMPFWVSIVVNGAGSG